MMTRISSGISASESEVMNRPYKRLIAMTLLTLLLSACDLAPTPQPPTGPTVPASPEVQGINTIVVAPTNIPGTPATVSTSPTGSIPTAVETEGASAAPTATSTSVAGCTPTQADAEGPFYKPNAPERTSVGKGHLLKGVVKSSLDCSHLPKAKIEFWQVNPRGEYDDAHRATLYSNDKGEYVFESNLPPAYEGRPPHIHVRVEAEGYSTLITQFYPAQGETEATFDLVLLPVGP